MAKRGSATSVGDDAPAPRRLLEVAPILDAAGWHRPEPVVTPVSLAEPGTLVRFTNVTGLIAGEKTLGAELGLLYSPPANRALGALELRGVRLERRRLRGTELRRLRATEPTTFVGNRNRSARLLEASSIACAILVPDEQTEVQGERNGV